MQGFQKTGGTILGVPIVRDQSILGPYWSSPTLGNFQIDMGSYQHLGDQENLVSKVNNRDSWDFDMAYWGYQYTYQVP